MCTKPANVHKFHVIQMGTLTYVPACSHTHTHTHTWSTCIHKWYGNMKGCLWGKTRLLMILHTEPAYIHKDHVIQMDTYSLMCPPTHINTQWYASTKGSLRGKVILFPMLHTKPAYIYRSHVIQIGTHSQTYVCACLRARTHTHTHSWTMIGRF